MPFIAFLWKDWRKEEWVLWYRTMHMEVEDVWRDYSNPNCAVKENNYIVTWHFTGTFTLKAILNLQLVLAISFHMLHLLFTELTISYNDPEIKLVFPQKHLLSCIQDLRSICYLDFVDTQNTTDKFSIIKISDHDIKVAYSSQNWNIIS